MTQMHELPVKFIEQIVKKYDNLCIFHTRKYDSGNYLSYIFIKPVKKIEIYNLAQLKPVFDRLETFISKGYYAAGWFSYECGYGLDYVNGEKPGRKYKFPLVRLYFYKDIIIFNHKTGKFNYNIAMPAGAGKPAGYEIKDFKFNTGNNEYVKNILKIKKLISQGDTYQVNYTIKSKFRVSGSIPVLYENLCNTQKVAYSSFIKSGKYNVLSFSPELFFRKSGNSIMMRPMKGTINRGINIEEDNKLAGELHHSEKNRSENVMIVDLIRNDLSKLSSPNNVKAVSLFDIEKYGTLFQMTSTVTAKVDKKIKFYDLFRAIFPSGSVTGAPKIRTMQIIRSLEKEPRHVYTGAIGFITPGRDAVFNVPIRTVIIDKNKGEMGIGSGITYDSSPAGEYEECKLKSLFLTKKRQPFQLIETILQENVKDESHENGYYLLNEHLLRLKQSAEYFEFPCDIAKIKKELFVLVNKDCCNFHFTKEGYRGIKVRLLLDNTGKTVITRAPLQSFTKEPLKIKISAHKTCPKDVFLYHKTTLRELYNTEYKKFSRQGYFDVLYMNKQNQVTEFSRGNIIIKKNNRFYTPPISCGLLPGVFRSHFIRKNKVIEKVLSLNDIRHADNVYFSNAVVKLAEIEIP